MDYVELLRKGFTLWFTDKKMLKYVGVYFVISLVGLGALLGVMALFFASSSAELTGVIEAFNDPTGQGAVDLLTDGTFAQLLGKFFIFLLIATPIILFFSLLHYYIWVLMLGQSLELAGFRTVEINLMKILKLIVLEIWVSIVAITSLYSKFFIVFIILFILSIIGIIIAFINTLVAGVLAIILLFAWLLYFGIIIYNSIRLAFAPIIYLQQDIGIAQCCRRAWDFSKGRVLGIFIAFLVVGAAIFAVAFILSLFSGLIWVIISFATGIDWIGQIIDSALSFVTAPIYAAIGALTTAFIYAEFANTKQK